MKNTLTIGFVALACLFLKAESTPPNASCGKVLNLNGTSSDYVVMNRIADTLVAIDDNDKFTVEFWMKTTASTGNIFSVYTSTEFVNVEIYIRLHGGKIGTSETFTSLFTETAEQVNDNLWHHVAMSFNGDLARLYVDGEYIGNEDYSFFFQDNSKVSLGMADIPGSGKRDFFKGQLDELKIWKTVRTEEEINSGMNLSLIGDESDLLAYYDFNEVNNLDKVLNNSLYDFDFNLKAENVANARQNPDGSAPTKIENVVITNPSCFELEDGSLEIEAFTQATSVEYSFSDELGLGDDNTLNGLADGNYNILIKDSEGCYDSLTVELDDGEPYEVTLEFNDEYSFFDADISPSASGAQYQWLNCETGNLLSEGVSARFYPEETGEYQVVYVRNENCTYVSDCAPFGDVSINNLNISQQLSVFPNPTNGKVNINFDAAIKGALVSLSDLTGKSIKTFVLEDEMKRVIDLTSFENGVYFIRVAKGDDSAVYKVIKR